MNNTIFSPFNQTGTLEKANGPGVKEKKKAQARIGRGSKGSSNGKPVAVAKTA